MRISDLPGGTLGTNDVVAVDDGGTNGTTRKVGLKAEIEAAVSGALAGLTVSEKTADFNTGSTATQANFLSWLNGGSRFSSSSGIYRILSQNGKELGVATVSYLDNSYAGMYFASYYTALNGYYRYNTTSGWAAATL